MASIPGLFKRGGSYYLRIVLPKDHPLQSQYRNGRWVQTLGPCSHREAVLLGTRKRAEVLSGYSPLPTPAVNAPAALPAPSSPFLKPIRLREVYDRWTVAEPRTPDTIAACGLALKLYEEQTGNPDIRQLTRAQGESFRTWLQSLPATSKTTRNRLIWVRALLRYATEDLEWLRRNPWDKLDLPYRTTNKRRPWTDDELRVFFAQPLYTQRALPTDRKAGREAAYWIPLLGLYTGARLGELAQLRLTDIQTFEGTPVLSITDEGEGQSVKTEAGVRLVPIHSELIRLGFLKYVEGLRASTVDLLWPLLPLRQGKPGGYFSQWFADAKKAVGIVGYPDFHCFRHTVRTKLADAEIAEDVIDLLMGHEARGSVGTKVYTHRTMSTMRKGIESLKYSECLP